MFEFETDDESDEEEERPKIVLGDDAKLDDDDDDGASISTEDELAQRAALVKGLGGTELVLSALLASDHARASLDARTSKPPVAAE